MIRRKIICALIFIILLEFALELKLSSKQTGEVSNASFTVGGSGPSSNSSHGCNKLFF
jgi:hypothetical protein